MPNSIKNRVAVRALFLGLFGFICLIAWQGVDPLMEAFSKGGWKMLLLPLPFLFALILMTRAWGVLFPSSSRPFFLPLFFFNWIGIAINWLLPVAQMGGEVIKAVWLGRASSIPGYICGSSVVVEKTIQAMAQAIVATIGVALLLDRAGSMDLILISLVFILLLSLGTYFFYRMQLKGLFARLVQWRIPGGNPMSQWAGDAQQMDSAIKMMYENRKAIWESMVFRVLSRLVLAVEIWFALGLLGYPVDWTGALLLECLGQTIRAAAFVIPGAFGVQEGGFMVLGWAIGLPLEISLTLSLVKRVRELLVGLPALLVWQVMEHRFFAQE